MPHSIRSEGFIQARLGLEFGADMLTFAKDDFPTFDEESQLSPSILHNVPWGAIKGFLKARDSTWDVGLDVLFHISSLLCSALLYLA